jgi:ABC-type molybdate transport system permease subunit
VEQRGRRSSHDLRDGAGDDGGIRTGLCEIQVQERDRRLLLTPMVVPLVITALAFYFAFAKMNILGSYAGIVLAHTVLATPFVLVTVMATLQGFDRNLVRAALNLGARPFPAFMSITLPLIFPGVLAGAIFAFITSFDEIVVALFVSSPSTKTLPIELYAGLREQLTRHHRHSRVADPVFRGVPRPRAIPARTHAPRARGRCEGLNPC